MTKKNKRASKETNHINLSYGEFIISPYDDYKKIRDHVTNILGALFMEYDSIEVAGLGITKWADKLWEAKCLTNEPIAIRIFGLTPNSLTYRGTSLKTRWEYFESTCDVNISEAILTGEALKLWSLYKDTEAIEAAFAMKNGA